ncbi:MAG: ATPase, T2SS/T4P/T4SS family, partial [Patescibacteria group bacterium]|nr:ATPase, T2SS/T4P/T4SS family [Patescibacteria group bacterium]
MMQVQDEKKLEEVLVQLNLVKPEQLDLAKIESVRGGRDVTNVLVDMGFISVESMTKAKAVSLGIPYVDLSGINIEQKILKYVPKNLAERFRAVPFKLVSGNLKVAMLDPNNVQAIEYIEKKSGLSVTPYLASDGSIKNALDQYQDITTEVGEALKSIELGPVIEIKQNEESDKTISQDAPVTRAVNTILEYAIKAKASDVHIEPREKIIKIRYRIDGVLHETMSLPVHILAAIISRIKILSNLKIDEHRVPQDGRFGLKIDEKEVDVRVAVSPTVFGEKVVMRLLDKSSGLITLEDLGIKGRGYKLIEEGAKRPHGMILSTGPTGSGKSTTLYALLNKMNSTEVNIITLEDPVEYQIDGINQIQINSG